MTDRKTQEEVTLLEVLIDGFEKNEIWYGFHFRELPMLDEATAIKKFAALTDEATRWKGPPIRTDETSNRRLAAWNDLEIRQAGRGIMVRAREPRFDSWWHEDATWEDDPMGPIHEWISREVASKSG